MEFTRLTQLTGDPKYYDAVQRIMNELEIGQDKTRMPGMWPTWIDTDRMTFDDSEFTIGGCADSAYEYLLTQRTHSPGCTDGQISQDVRKGH